MINPKVKGAIAPFPCLNSLFDENELNVNEGVLELMKRHISIFGEEIRQYFPDLEDFQKYFRFVNNTFGTDVGDLPSQDNLLKTQFELIWCMMKMREAYLVKSLAETFELKWHKPT